MLEEAVMTARAGGAAAAEAAEAFTPQINIGMPVLIPDRYVADLNLRLGLYRRLSNLVDRAEIDAFAAELVDRFGPLPPEVDNLGSEERRVGKEGVSQMKYGWVACPLNKKKH